MKIYLQDKWLYKSQHKHQYIAWWINNCTAELRQEILQFCPPVIIAEGIFFKACDTPTITSAIHTKGEELQMEHAKDGVYAEETLL